MTKNSIAGRGGGIGGTSSGTIELRNTIIAGNAANYFPDADVSGAVISHGHNLIGNTAGSSGWLATDLLNRNAALGPLANNGGPTMTHALMPNSQAVNSGGNALAVDPVTGTALTGDQRGSPRFVGTVDIGAFESNFTVTYVMFVGRVTTSDGRGVSKAVVTLSNGQETIYALTNPFGYYRFVNLLSGSSYMIAVNDKRYEFSPPQAITLTTNPPDINFVAQ
ncbi:MAG: carboxypeptidase regulatory-like domain-containing protein [Pyrinomonadaceae bacterium]|nr:carboxypeptidase regulatory-like domain-containing protein [Pyrinomonadaceae bacterium]